MITNATAVAFLLGFVTAAAWCFFCAWHNRRRGDRRRATAKRDAHARHYNDPANRHTHAMRGHPQTCWDADCPKPRVEVHLTEIAKEARQS